LVTGEVVEAMAEMEDRFDGLEPALEVGDEVRGEEVPECLVGQEAEGRREALGCPIEKGGSTSECMAVPPPAPAAIRTASADRAAGYFITRSDADPNVNARTSGVFLRADADDLSVLDGRDGKRVELIAERLRNWKFITSALKPTGRSSRIHQADARLRSHLRTVR
jgi:hypothetical protein